MRRRTRWSSCTRAAAAAGQARARGAELVAWNIRLQDWESLASNAAESARPATLQARVTDARTRELIGPNGKAYLQCRALGSSGAGFSTVSLDHLEVRMRLRRP
jgi:hypothetical protein